MDQQKGVAHAPNSNSFLRLDIGHGQKNFILHGPNMRRNQKFRLNANHTLSDYNIRKTFHQSLLSSSATATAADQTFQSFMASATAPAAGTAVALNRFSNPKKRAPFMPSTTEEGTTYIPQAPSSTTALVANPASQQPGAPPRLLNSDLPLNILQPVPVRHRADSAATAAKYSLFKKAPIAVKGLLAPQVVDLSARKMRQGATSEKMFQMAINGQPVPRSKVTVWRQGGVSEEGGRAIRSDKGQDEGTEEVSIATTTQAHGPIHTIPHAQLITKLPLSFVQKDQANSSTLRQSSSKHDKVTAVASSSHYNEFNQMQQNLSSDLNATQKPEQPRISHLIVTSQETFQAENNGDAKKSGETLQFTNMAALEAVDQSKGLQQQQPQSLNSSSQFAEYSVPMTETGAFFNYTKNGFQRIPQKRNEMIGMFDTTNCNENALTLSKKIGKTSLNQTQKHHKKRKKTIDHFSNEIIHQSIKVNQDMSGQENAGSSAKKNSNEEVKIIDNRYSAFEVSRHSATAPTVIDPSAQNRIPSTKQHHPHKQVNFSESLQQSESQQASQSLTKTLKIPTFENGSFADYFTGSWNHGGHRTSSGRRFGGHMGLNMQQYLTGQTRLGEKGGYDGQAQNQQSLLSHLSSGPHLNYQRSDFGVNSLRELSQVADQQFLTQNTHDHKTSPYKLPQSLQNAFQFNQPLAFSKQNYCSENSTSYHKTKHSQSNGGAFGIAIAKNGLQNVQTSSQKRATRHAGSLNAQGKRSKSSCKFQEMMKLRTYSESQLEQINTDREGTIESSGASSQFKCNFLRKDTLVSNNVDNIIPMQRGFQKTENVYQMVPQAGASKSRNFMNPQLRTLDLRIPAKNKFCPKIAKIVTQTKVASKSLQFQKELAKKAKENNYRKQKQIQVANQPFHDFVEESKSQMQKLQLDGKRQDGKNIIALQQKRNLDQKFTMLEEEINKLAYDRWIYSTNLFYADWEKHQFARIRRLTRNPLVDNREPSFIRGLDVSLAIRKYKEQFQDKALQDFIKRRLLGSMDLLKHQQDNQTMLNERYQKDCIQCAVKQKIRNYLIEKDILHPEAIPHGNKILRKQLKTVSNRDLALVCLQPVDETDPDDVMIDYKAQCSHLENIESICAKEEVVFYQYLEYLETIKRQPDISLEKIIDLTMSNFYDISATMTKEERQVFQNPENFRTLLLSPWTNLVKNLTLEEQGLYVFTVSTQKNKQGEQHQSEDKIFEEILDMEVREVMDQVYQQFRLTQKRQLTKVEEFFINQANKLKVLKKEEYFQNLVVCCRNMQVSSTGQDTGGNNSTQFGSYRRCEELANNIRKNLRVFFKDQSLRQMAMCFGVRDNLDFYQNDLRDTFSHLLNNKNFFMFSKLNIASHHTSLEDKSHYLTQPHDPHLFEYVQQQRDCKRLSRMLVGQHEQDATKHQSSQKDPPLVVKQQQFLKTEKKVRIPPCKEVIELPNMARKSLDFRHISLKALQRCDYHSTDLISCQTQYLNTSSFRNLDAYPNPLNLIDDQTLNICNLHDLHDIHCQSLGTFLQHQLLRDVIIQDCSLTDQQLAYILHGVSQEFNVFSLKSLRIGGQSCQIGPKSIAEIKNIIVNNAQWSNLTMQRKQEIMAAHRDSKFSLNLEKIDSFWLSEPCISLKNLSNLIQEILDTEYMHFTVLKITKCHINDDELFQKLLRLIQIQDNLTSLSFQDSKLTLKQMKQLLELIHEKEMQNSLKFLGLGGNMISTTNNELTTDIFELLYRFLEKVTNFEVLDLQNTLLSQEHLETLIARIKSSPICFHTARLTYADISQREYILKMFDIDRDFIDEKPIDLVKDQNKQPQVDFKSKSDVQKMLVSQHQSKKNRNLVKADAIQFGNDCIEVFRLVNFKEHIFTELQSLLTPKIFDYDLSRQWQINTFKGYCQDQMVPTLIVLDASTLSHPSSPWKPCPTDYALLSSIGHSSCHPLAHDLPILVCRTHVQSMLPAHIFALISFLLEEKERLSKEGGAAESAGTDQRFVSQQSHYSQQSQRMTGEMKEQGDERSFEKKQNPQLLKERKEEMLQAIDHILRDIAEMFQNHAMYMPAPQCLWNTKSQGSNSQQKIEFDIIKLQELISQKCEGWFEYFKMHLLNSRKSRYKQVVGVNADIWDSLNQRLDSKFRVMSPDDDFSYSQYHLQRLKQTSDCLDPIYITTTFLKPLAKVQTLKVFVPSPGYQQDVLASEHSIGRMYQWQGIVTGKRRVRVAG